MTQLTARQLRHALAFVLVALAAACGPQTAQVEGVVLGVQVDAGFARTNGCEIERWDRLRPLVPLHSD